jgi:hypothetical protein
LLRSESNRKSAAQSVNPLCVATSELELNASISSREARPKRDLQTRPVAKSHKRTHQGNTSQQCDSVFPLVCASFGLGIAAVSQRKHTSPGAEPQQQRAYTLKRTPESAQVKHLVVNA